MAKTIFITGVTGLIGTYLARHLVETGYEVIGMSRTPSKIEGVRIIPFDIGQNSFLDLSSELDEIDFDGVIHLAAIIPGPETDSNSIREINVEFTQQLAEYFAEQKRSIPFAFASTLSFLRRPLAPIITEDHFIEADHEYGKSKLEAEEYLQELEARGMLKVSILRISSPIPDSYDMLPNTVVRLWIDAARKGKDLVVHGSGKRAQDFVSVHDLAEAFELAIINRASGIFNVASGSVLSMKDLADTICNRFGSNWTLDESKPDNNEIWNISIAKARQEFGYQPRFTARGSITNLLNSIEDGDN